MGFFDFLKMDEPKPRAMRLSEIDALWMGLAAERNACEKTRARLVEASQNQRPPNELMNHLMDLADERGNLVEKLMDEDGFIRPIVRCAVNAYVQLEESEKARAQEHEKFEKFVRGLDALPTRFAPPPAPASQKEALKKPADSGRAEPLPILSTFVLPAQFSETPPQILASAPPVVVEPESPIVQPPIKPQPSEATPEQNVPPPTEPPSAPPQSIPAPPAPTPTHISMQEIEENRNRRLAELAAAQVPITSPKPAEKPKAEKYKNFEEYKKANPGRGNYFGWVKYCKEHEIETGFKHKKKKK